VIVPFEPQRILNWNKRRIRAINSPLTMALAAATFAAPPQRLVKVDGTFV
jgi:hypothetical protein